MDNMKPLIDAVSEDKRKDTATDDEAGRPECRGATQGGQRVSSCGHRGRSKPPHWAGMMSHMTSPCGPRCGQPGGPSFMHGSSAFGPMTCPWGTRPQWTDERVDDESDEEHAGRETTENGGKEAHDPHKRQGGAGDETTGQQHSSCPRVERMRRHRMRHANVDCRRHDPCPMYRRCRRGLGAQSHCPLWSTVLGDCCQPGAPMGWGGCPYPSPFFSPFSCDSAVESNSDAQNDNHDQKTPEAFCPFFQGPSGFGDGRGPCCYGNGRGWQCCPPRNKLYQMLSWKRDVLNEKLQRIESHLERLRPSEESTKKATTGENAGPEQALSMSTAPEAPSPMDTHVRERGWEEIADSV